jgi:hypothetical protein
MDARRAPDGIGERHSADEFGKLRADWRSTDSSAPRLPSPEVVEALPVPTNHSLGAARRGPLHRSLATGSRQATPRAGFDFPFGRRRRVRGRAVQDAARLTLVAFRA